MADNDPNNNILFIDEGNMYKSQAFQLHFQ